jgi:hypothetical protein
VIAIDAMGGDACGDRQGKQAVDAQVTSTCCSSARRTLRAHARGKRHRA